MEMINLYVKKKNPEVFLSLSYPPVLNLQLGGLTR